ncbi:MAG: malate dehydrogenase [Spirochaetales bacterium]|nr:malate dehydrogenase [Spirochaetales bacterium]
MSYIGIVGSGNVGANTAFFIAEKGIEDVRLYDIQEGTAKGKSLDIMEAAPVRRYRNKISGADSLSDLKQAEMVVISAGTGRKPGQRPEDLFEINKDIIVQLARDFKQLNSPGIFIIATEPVDMLTTVFVEESGFVRERVIGLGGILDCTRLNYLVSRELGVSTENIACTVIGRHSNGMIFLPQYSCVSGIPLAQIMDHERIDAIISDIREAGNLIVDMAQRSSAYYAPSAACAELVDSIHMNLRRLFCVSVFLQGEYGYEGVALSLPCIIGKKGIEKVLAPELTSSQKHAFSISVEEIKSILEKGAVK